MKKILTISVLTAVGALMTLTSCGEKPEVSSQPASEAPATSENGGSTTPTVATLTGSYLSPAKLSYMNARPTYNYYLTTYDFEGLQTYSDNTYILTVASMSYSGLILPEKGNEATGSERGNYVEKFYGTFTSQANALDETMLDIKLSVPTRVTNAYNCQYFVDTAAWTDAMADAVSKDQYGNISETKHTAQSYLASQAFNEVTVSVTTSTASFDYFVLREQGSADPTVTVSTDTKGLTGAYLTPAKLTYMNMRPNYNYYMTIFTQDYVEIYSDGNYVASVYSADYSGLILPETGNDATGSERTNYIESFYGKYTSKANELDDTMADIKLAKPTRATLDYDAHYFIDSAAWTEKMSNDTASVAMNPDGTQGEKTIQYHNGEEYLAAVDTKLVNGMDLSVTNSTASFDFVELANKRF